MEKNKRFLSINDIQVGMVAARDIKTNGKVLIGQGVSFTELSISKLKEQLFLEKIEVYCESDNSTVIPTSNRFKSVEEIGESFNELSFDVEQLFDNMLNIRISSMEEMRKFASKIQSELESASAVVKNVVLYGSGSDTIYRHGVNVAALSTILGKWLGFNENQINLLTYSAIFHDFGKTKINKSIIEKPGSLTAKEYNEVKAHSVIGYDYIKEIPFLDKSVSYGVLMHHEREDASGYPLGLKGDKIHPFAKIIAIADVFDAVNSDRAYKKSRGPFEALEIIQRESLGRLDYEYCKVFLSHVVNYYMGESVLLNNNKICKIVQVDPNDLGRPLLFDDAGFIDLKQYKELHVVKLIL